MDSFCLKIFAFISFHLLLVHCNLTDSSTQTQLISNSLSDVACALRYCGQGRCKASSSLFGFDCECHPGWKKIQIGPLAFPSCVVPNCTVDFQCSKGSRLAPPPPPALSLPPALNLSNPCTLVWCGEGTCLANGTGYTCQCYEGSENLFNLTGAACFRQCNLGADCNGLRFGSPLSLSPSSSSSSSSSGTDISYGGSSEAPKCLRSQLPAISTIWSALIFVIWI